MSRPVATHQKTQQGLKPLQRSFAEKGACSRNASENPAGIETRVLYRKIEHHSGRNASENPAGIETYCRDRTNYSRSLVATHQKTQQGLKLGILPVTEGGLNVATHQKTQQGLKPFYVRKVHRAFAFGRNASENPAGIETLKCLSVPRSCECRNASENPAGIETSSPALPRSCLPLSQRIRKPSRD